MYLRAVGRRFTQMNAYFLVMNSKRCITALNNKCSSKKFYSDVEDTEIMAAGFKGKTNLF